MLHGEFAFLNWLFRTTEKIMLTNTAVRSDLATAAQAALQTAATNASGPGWKSSEFWVNVLAAAAGAVAVPVLGVSTGGIVGGVLAAVAIGYAHSRGNVKAAALAGASAGLAAAAASSNTTEQMAAKVGQNLIGTIAGAAKGLVLVGLLAAGLSSCATFRSDALLAEQQCGASGEIKAAGAAVAPYEAKAVACLASGTGSTIEMCESAVGAGVAARAVASLPEEVPDILRCAAAFVADAAKGKAIATPDAGAK